MPSWLETVHNVPDVQTDVTVRAFSLTLRRMLSAGESGVDDDDTEAPFTGSACCIVNGDDAIDDGELVVPIVRIYREKERRCVGGMMEGRFRNGGIDCSTNKTEVEGVRIALSSLLAWAWMRTLGRKETKKKQSYQTESGSTVGHSPILPWGWTMKPETAGTEQQRLTNNNVDLMALRSISEILAFLLLNYRLVVVVVVLRRRRRRRGSVRGSPRRCCCRGCRRCCSRRGCCCFQRQQKRDDDCRDEEENK